MIQIGHEVIIDDGGKKKTYLILGSSETNPRKGIISHNSPLGAELIGKRVGEKIKVKLKDKEVEYKIIQIK